RKTMLLRFPFHFEASPVAISAKVSSAMLLPFASPHARSSSVPIGAPLPRVAGRHGFLLAVGGIPVVPVAGVFSFSKAVTGYRVPFHTTRLARARLRPLLAFFLFGMFTVPGRRINLSTLWQVSARN